MILIICSQVVPKIDKALEAIKLELSKIDLEYTVINPHNLGIVQPQIGIIDGKIFFSTNNKPQCIKAVYLMRNVRCDSIVSMPQDVEYPSVYRNRMNQYIQDIRFLTEDHSWIPGGYQDVERADSKPSLFYNAKISGLDIPKFTINAFSFSGEDESVYKKSLGWPFVVSFSKTKQKEVGVTTINALEKSPIKDIQPWQWQEYINGYLHIRCCMIGESLWSVARKISEDTKDFRLVNQIQKKEIKWEKFDLPNEIKNKISILMSKMKLKIAQPEFIITENGRMVIIDLNPCGDWYGFFPTNVNQEIAWSIANLIKNEISPL